MSVGALAGGLAPASSAAFATATACGTAPDGMNVIVSNASVIRGTSGEDFICSTSSASNTILGLAGDDIIYSGGGNDIVRGGNGRDIVFAGAGNDRVFGGPGNDVLRGGNGNDAMVGGNGVDTLIGGNGQDTLVGNAGNDRMIGNLGVDRLRGGNGNDILWGGNGNDILWGGNGNDTLRGGTGDDIVKGGNGSDTIVEETETPTTATPSDGSTTNGINAAQWADNVTITMGADSFNYVSNGYPSHELPDQFVVPNDGNMPPFDSDDESAFTIENTADLITESPVNVDITLNPVYSDVATETGLGQIGLTISGAQLFNDYEDTARSIVALDDNFSIDGAYFIDACNGHPLATGAEYHYHGIPYCITDAVDVSGQHSTIIGVLLDGFPLYGSKDEGGVELANADLDECSGHIGATPEFPEGIYHYHLTADAAPYSIDCFHGEIDYDAPTNAGPGDGGGPPNGGPPGGGPPQ